MKKTVFWIFLAALLPGYAQEVDSTWVKNFYSKKEVMIPMRDGVKLFTAIYTPKTAGKYPILMVRTPYSVAPYGENKFSSRLYSTYYKQYL